MSALRDLLFKARVAVWDTDKSELSEDPWDAGPPDRPGARSPAEPASPAMDARPVKQLYSAFDASQPVAAANDLFGRRDQVDQLVDAVLHRRNHGFVAGRRGSGKTSLARVFGQNLDLEGIVVLYGACEDGSSFGEIIRGYLEQLPASSLAAGTEAEFQERVTNLPDHCTSSQATDLLARIRYSRLIIIGDEFDRVTDDKIRAKMALLMKLVSDARLPVRFVLIGDQASYDAVARAHPSLLRHMTYVPVEPLDRDSVVGLLRSCAGQCGMHFTEEALDLIADVVCGSPYHARLFGLHAALEASRAHEAQIGLSQAMAGVHKAFAEWTMLNSADAELLRRIAGGNHGDLEAYVRIARDSARQSTRAAAGEGDGRPSPADLKQIAEFGPTMLETSGGPQFREATAPQFLIALAHVMSRQSADIQQEHHSDA